MDIKEILGGGYVDRDAVVAGWIRSVRRSKRFCFLVVNDGSCQASLQVVVDGGMDGYEEASSMLPGTSCRIHGKVVESGGRGQAFEMQARKVEVLGASGEDYPIQKKSLSLEFLREQAHLRVRTNLFGAVFRIRHRMAMATHGFFHRRGFYYLNSPILTTIDAEGAGEQFTVTALDLDDPPRNDKGKLDFGHDYFSEKAGLCVSGQLEAECFAAGLGRVYTFGPTFRSENSNTSRHLAEFWMIEPEAAFYDLDDNAKLATDYIKYLIEDILEYCADELEFLSSRDDVADNHRDILKHVSNSRFQKISYTEAVDILRKSGEKFEYAPEWGKDLQTEHERYLTEKHFDSPLIVVDYPKDIKAFYMRQNDDGKTVRAMDVLVPGIGEIIGGSQREERLDRLVNRMRELKMDEAPLWWYLDLRKFGTVPHAGFGLGFERAVMYVTGMKNIRDVIPFARTPRNCSF